MNTNKGFTLIELLIVVAITAVLSSIVMFSTTKYIGQSKDSNISGSLAVLIPAGEAWYNANGNSYVGFCSSDVVINIFSQMPADTNHTHSCATNTYNGLNQSWIVCAKDFTTTSMSFCVDSRGVKNKISDCSTRISNCATTATCRCS